MISLIFSATYLSIIVPNKTHKIHTFQDVEVGLEGTGTIPTEEAIRILVNSYKSSDRNQDVQSEVSVLSEKVSFLAN